MKKLFALLLVTVMLILGNEAQAQQLKFYYYPGQNVYYNPGKKQYIYFVNGAWTPVAVLPPAIVIGGAPRVIVYSDGPQVWKLNGQHKVKYKNYPNGKATGYQGSNPNKGKGKKG